MSIAGNVVAPSTYERASVYDKKVETIREAARYVERHATDFVGCYGSDEVTVTDGIDITIHVRVVDAATTITVMREMFVLDCGGDAS